MNGGTSSMPKRRLGELEGRNGITGGPEGYNRPGIYIINEIQIGLVLKERRAHKGKNWI